MNKITASIVALIILSIVGGVFYLLSTNDDKTTQEDSITQIDQSPATQSDGATVAPAEQPGVYADYTADTIASTPGTKILFFHASWCPQCRAIEEDIKRDGVPANTAIIKVDYDSNQALRQKYGVTIQTTLVKIDDQGNLVEKFVAYDDPTLDSIIENLL